jgi:predicted deacetylase
LRALCISIHDVAPRTLPACEAIADAIERIHPRLPLTLLVVPHYHGDTGLGDDFVRWISHRLQRGDELALHGFTHRDDAQPASALLGRLKRRVYTAGEGEFSSLSEEDARERIARGRAWFDERGWKAEGFIAPAWLVSSGTWQALRRSDFLYTTTLSRFHLLQRGVVLRAPSVVYSARSTWRRAASRAWNSGLACATRRMPVVRFGFHPADASHRDLMSHASRLIDVLARDRTPLTKAAYVRSVG